MAEVSKLVEAARAARDFLAGELDAHERIMADPGTLDPQFLLELAQEQRELIAMLDFALQSSATILELVVDRGPKVEPQSNCAQAAKVARTVHGCPGPPYCFCSADVNHSEAGPPWQAS